MIPLSFDNYIRVTLWKLSNAIHGIYPLCLKVQNTYMKKIYMKSPNRVQLDIFVNKWSFQWQEWITSIQRDAEKSPIRMSQTTQDIVKIITCSLQSDSKIYCWRQHQHNILNSEKSSCCLKRAFTHNDKCSWLIGGTLIATKREMQIPNQ